MGLAQSISPMRLQAAARKSAPILSFKTGAAALADVRPLLARIVEDAISQGAFA